MKNCCALLLLGICFGSVLYGERGFAFTKYDQTPSLSVMIWFVYEMYQLGHSFYPFPDFSNSELNFDSHKGYPVFLRKEEKECFLRLNPQTENLSRVINEQSPGCFCLLEPGIYHFDANITLRDVNLSVSDQTDTYDSGLKDVGSFYAMAEFYDLIYFVKSGAGLFEHKTLPANPLSPQNPAVAVFMFSDTVYESGQALVHLEGSSQLSDVILVQKRSSVPRISSNNDRSQLKNSGVLALVSGIMECPVKKNEGNNGIPASGSQHSQEGKGGLKKGSVSQTSLSSVGAGAGSEPPDDPKSFEKLLKHDGLEKRDLLIVILRHLLGYLTYIKKGDTEQLIHRINVVLNVLSEVGGEDFPISNFEKTLQYLLGNEMGLADPQQTLNKFFDIHRKCFATLEQQELNRLRNVLVQSLAFYINPLSRVDVTDRMIAAMRKVGELQPVVEKAEAEHKASVKAAAQVQKMSEGARERAATLQRELSTDVEYLTSTLSRRKPKDRKVTRRRSLRSATFRKNIQQKLGVVSGDHSFSGSASADELETGSLSSAVSLMSIDSIASTVSLQEADWSLSISASGGAEPFLLDLFRQFVTKGSTDEINGSFEGSGIFMLLTDSLTFAHLKELQITLGLDSIRSTSFPYAEGDQTLWTYNTLVAIYCAYIKKRRSSRKKFIQLLAQIMGSDFETAVLRIEAEYKDRVGLSKLAYRKRVVEIQQEIQDQEEALRRQLSTQSGMLTALLSNLYQLDSSDPFTDEILEIIFEQLDAASVCALAESIGLPMTQSAAASALKLEKLRIIIRHHFGIGQSHFLEAASPDQPSLINELAGFLIESMGEEHAANLIQKLPDPKKIREKRRPPVKKEVREMLV